MKKADKKKINDYLDELIEERDIYGIDDYYDKVKEKITSDFRKDGNFIIKILDFIDREVKRTKKDLNPKIKQSDKDKLLEYLGGIYINNNHILHNYLVKAVDEKLINFGFADDVTPYFLLARLIEKIITYFHILDLFEQDRKNLLKEKRDKKKIIDAIDLIKSHTTNEHLQYELEIEKNNIKIINKTILYSSFFCEFTYAIRNLFKHDNKTVANLRIQELSQEIMYQIYNVNRDYRITTHITSILYKNYVLHRYYYDKESDKRKNFYKKYSFK